MDTIVPKPLLLYVAGVACLLAASEAIPVMTHLSIAVIGVAAAWHTRRQLFALSDLRASLPCLGIVAAGTSIATLFI